MSATPSRATPVPRQNFSAIILGGDRVPEDPLVEAAGVSCKALVPVAGKPMVLRVLAALADSPWVEERILCGPPRSAWQDTPAMVEAVRDGGFQWMENQASPSRSAAHAMAGIPAHRPVLITTADHALLDGAIIDHFCTRAMSGDWDVVVALADHGQVVRAFPGVHRTALRFRDAAYSGCNLFAIPTPEGRRIADFWTRIESQRKNPFRVVGAAGWMAVLRYLLGRLTLEEGLQRISRRLGLRVGTVLLPYPQAAVDVDTVQDWQLVERIASAAPSPA